MTGLLFAHEVARAADVEVVAGQREPGAKAVEGLHDLQPPLGVRRQAALAVEGQIAIAPQLGAPDPPPQLVQRRQAEHIRAVDDDGVHGRDIQTALDDVGGEQNVELAVIEGVHHVFQLTGAHLPVRRGHLELRGDALEPLAHVGEVAHPGADDIGLPAAELLPHQRFAQNDTIPRHDEGSNREPVDRRGGNQ